MRFQYHQPSRAYLLRLILIYALVLLCVAVPVTVSRYVASDDAQDQAGVAKFDITQSGTLTKTIEDLSFGGSEWEHTYTFEITNHSEVDVLYSVAVTSSGNLPLVFLWDGAATAVPLEGKKLESGSDSATHSLTVRWDGPKSAQYSGLVDRIFVTVVCEQTNTSGG